MTKKEITDILTERGIEHNPLALKAELEALLPTDLVNTPPSEDLCLTGAIKPIDEKVDIYNKYGVYIRTYSQEIHGEDYIELAKQFQSKIDN